MKNKIAKVVGIYARHRRPALKRKGTFYSRKAPYLNARMTLWAITDSGDHVWLDTREGLNSKRIELKLNEYEEANRDKVGRTIEYTPSGFIRSYV